MIFTAQDAQTTIGINVFRFTKLKTCDEAIRTLQQEFNTQMGIKLKFEKPGKTENQDVATPTLGPRVGRSGTNGCGGTARSAGAAC